MAIPLQNRYEKEARVPPSVQQKDIHSENRCILSETEIIAVKAFFKAHPEAHKINKNKEKKKDKISPDVYQDMPNLPFSVMRLSNGRLIAHYETLGEGTFGKVKLAQTLDTKEWAILKKTKKRFKIENRLSSEESYQLANEAHVLKATGSFIGENLYIKDEMQPHYTYSKYVWGEDLTYTVKGTLSANDRIKIALASASAIQNLHNKNIIHRDLKPDNMRWDKKTETLQLIDFGSSVELDPGHEFFLDNNMTGSEGYQAPETLTPIQKKPGPKTGTYDAFTHKENYYTFSKSGDAYALGSVLSDIFKNAEFSDNKDTEAVQRIIQGLKESDAKKRMSIEEAQFELSALQLKQELRTLQQPEGVSGMVVERRRLMYQKRIDAINAIPPKASLSTKLNTMQNILKEMEKQFSHMGEGQAFVKDTKSLIARALNTTQSITKGLDLKKQKETQKHADLYQRILSEKRPKERENMETYYCSLISANIEDYLLKNMIHHPINETQERFLNEITLETNPIEKLELLHKFLEYLRFVGKEGYSPEFQALLKKCSNQVNTLLNSEHKHHQMLSQFPGLNDYPSTKALTLMNTALRQLPKSLQSTRLEGIFDKVIHEHKNNPHIEMHLYAEFFNRLKLVSNAWGFFDKKKEYQHAVTEWHNKILNVPYDKRPALLNDMVSGLKKYHPVSLAERIFGKKKAILVPEMLAPEQAKPEVIPVIQPELSDKMQTIHLHHGDQKKTGVAITQDNKSKGSILPAHHALTAAEKKAAAHKQHLASEKPHQNVRQDIEAMREKGSAYKSRWHWKKRH